MIFVNTPSVPTRLTLSGGMPDLIPTVALEAGMVLFEEPSTTKQVAARAVWPALAPIRRFYPGFAAWYLGKVIPGICDGTRRMLCVGDPAAPLAVAIAKREAGERKICTMWIAPKARGRGLAKTLFLELIEWLDDERPLFTVPEERHAEFLPLMRVLEFQETARLPSLYRPGVTEHIYNGVERSFRAS